MWARTVPNASASAPRPNLAAPVRWTNVAAALVVDITTQGGMFHVFIGTRDHYLPREFASRSEAEAAAEDLLDGIG